MNADNNMSDIFIKCLVPLTSFRHLHNNIHWQLNYPQRLCNFILCKMIIISKLLNLIPKMHKLKKFIFIKNINSKLLTEKSLFRKINVNLDAQNSEVS